MKHIVKAVLFLALLAPTGAAPQEDQPFKVIVNASNPVTSMTRAQVSALFLKKTTRWEHDGKIQPVDQLKSSELRIRFSEAVHGKDVRAVDGYWQSQVYSGRSTPPPELASDAEVLDYVRSNSAAVGYVSTRASLGDGVKTVHVSD